MSDIDRIRERHRVAHLHEERFYGTKEQCEVLIVLDALDESKADTLRMGHNWEDALAQRNAAYAEADRLAALVDDLARRYDASITGADRERIAHIATMRQAAESLRRERMLAEALRGHEPCNMWGSTDEKVLRQHDDAINRSADDTVDDTKSQGGSDREPDGTSHDPAASGTGARTDRPDAPMRDAVVAAAIRWRQADTADPSMWPDEQRELAEAVDALLGNSSEYYRKALSPNSSSTYEADV